MSGAFDIIVAGGGIAGLSAGHEAATLGASVLVLTGDVPGGHLLSIENVENWPGHPDGIAGYALCPDIQLEAAERGAEYAATTLDGLRIEDDTVIVETGEGPKTGRTLIVATGTSFAEIEVPGIERYWGRGLSHCASCDAPLLRDKPVAVIGGGDSAMQEALTLAEHASQVSLIVRDADLAGQDLLRERVQANPRIALRTGATLEAVHGEDGLDSITLSDGELKVSGLFVYIGLRPNSACLDGLVALAPDGGIPTSAGFETALRGVYAAGTVRAGSEGRATAAAEEGRGAARAAHAYFQNGHWEGVG